MTRGSQPTSPRPADTTQIVNRSMWVNYDAWNRYVLMAIGLFALLLYVGLIYAGFSEFMSRLSKGSKNKRRTRSRTTPRRLRSPKVSGD